MLASGMTSWTTSAALVSNSEFTGEKTEEIAIALIPLLLMSLALISLGMDTFTRLAAYFAISLFNQSYKVICFSCDTRNVTDKI